MAKMTLTARYRKYEMKKGKIVRRAKPLPAQPRQKITLNKETGAYIMVGPDERVNVNRRIRKGKLHYEGQK